MCTEPRQPMVVDGMEKMSVNRLIGVDNLLLVVGPYGANQNHIYQCNGKAASLDRPWPQKLMALPAPALHTTTLQAFPKLMYLITTCTRRMLL